MSGEVEPSSREPLPRVNVELGDMIAVGARVNGEVVKYSWPLGPDGVSMETTPTYVNGERVRTDVVIRFSFTETA